MNANHSDEALINLPQIQGPGEPLAKNLLEGKLISYQDERFQVSSGDCRFIFKLIQDKNKFVLFYAQVPSIYPLPDDLKLSVKTELESMLKQTIEIDFINAGTQAQKDDILHSALMGD